MNIYKTVGTYGGNLCRISKTWIFNTQNSIKHSNLVNLVMRGSGPEKIFTYSKRY